MENTRAGTGAECIAGASASAARYRSGRFPALASVLLLLVTHSVVADQPLRLALRSTFPVATVGFLIAAELGFYAEEGLEVIFIPSEATSSTAAGALDSLTNDSADLAIGGTEVLADTTGTEPLAAVFTVFQSSPARIFLKRDAGISTLSQIAERPIVLSAPGGRLRTETEAVLAINGISIDDLNLVVAAPDDNALELILSDGVAGFPGSLLATEFVMDGLGVKLLALDPGSYGLDFYGETVFATDRFARERASELDRFRAASRRGWEHAFAHPEETIEFLVTNTELPAIVPPTIPPEEFVAWQLAVVERLSGHPVVEVGYSSPARWSRIAAALEELAIAEPGVVHTRFVFDYQMILADQQRERVLLLSLLAGLALCVAAVVVLGPLFAARARMRREIGQLIDGLLHGVAYFRADGQSYRLGRANRMMQVMVGLSPEQEQAGSLTAAALLSGLGLPPAEAEEALEQVRLGEAPVRRDSIVSADGSRYYSASLFAMGRETIGVAVLDVTSEHTARQALEELVHQRTVTIREVHHRVRNNMQIITSLMNLQAGQLVSPEATRFHTNMQNQIRALSVAHEMLYEDFTDQHIAVETYVHRVAGDTLHNLQQQPASTPFELDLEINGAAGVLTSLDTAIPVGLIVTEAITNTERHAFPAGVPVDGVPPTLSIRCRKGSGHQIELTIRDNGAGFARGALHSGLGIRIMEMLSEQIGGNLSVSAAADKGTAVSLTIPAERIVSGAGEFS